MAFALGPPAKYIPSEIPTSSKLVKPNPKHCTREFVLNDSRDAGNYPQISLLILYLEATRVSAGTCIIIPIYNEAERFQKQNYVRFAAKNPHIKFLLVNDGSLDGSLAMIRKLESQFPAQFEVLNIKINQGKAEAVRQGFLQAFESEYPFIGFWDADLATPLSAIQDFQAAISCHSSIDVVIGSRLNLLGHNVQRKFVRRRIGGCCSVLASLVLKSRIRDSQCGAKLFRTTPEVKFAFSAPLRSRWLFDVELLARLRQAWTRRETDRREFGKRVFELPLLNWREVPGSSLKKMDFVKATVEMCQIYWSYRKPLQGADISVIENLERKPQPSLPTSQVNKAA